MSQAAKKHSTARTLIEFFSSMYFAIGMLCLVGIASVIGTVLQQNKPYTDYIIKFGPYWHEVFKSIGLYDVYTTVWFLLLVFFLVLSTSVCIYRNVPTMLREFRQYRENAKVGALKTMRHTQTYQVDDTVVNTVRNKLTGFLGLSKFQFKHKQQDDYELIAAKKGSWNRIGYILTHVGMVVIIVFAFIDGKSHLMFKEWFSGKKIETRSIPIKDISPASKFSVGELVGFRGVINIPEGEQRDFVALSQRDGYFIQALPFSIKLKDFRIEYYKSGQPSSFESDLIITDKDSDKTFEHTISVNHPLIYRGYAIFQASFEDGGSKLNLKAWPLGNVDTRPLDLTLRVFENKKLQTHQGKFTVELSEFKAINVFPNDDKNSRKKFKNMGPSFVYRLRDKTGQAKEYINYLLPVTQQGRLFYLSGMRPSVAEDYRYLHIPLDPAGGLDRFLKFQSVLQDDARLKQIVKQAVVQSIKGSSRDTPEMRRQVAVSMFKLVKLFAKGGYVALDKEIRATVPEDKQQQAAGAYIKVLENALQNIYLLLLRDEGVDLSKGMSEVNGQFFEDAINAIAGIGVYGSPFYMQLTNFEHREASGLQISLAPGQKYVYLGCVMLIVGVFMMFYVVQQRIWIVIKNPDKTTGKGEILVAGMANRNEADFDKYFVELNDRLQQAIPELRKV